MKNDIGNWNKPPRSSLFGGQLILWFVFGVCSCLLFWESWKACAEDGESPYLFVLGLVFLMPVFFVGMFPNRMAWAKYYSPDIRFLIRDRRDEIGRRWLWKWELAAGAVLVVFKLAFFKVLAAAVLIAGVALIILGVRGMKKAEADREAVGESSFTVRELTLTRKYRKIRIRQKDLYYLTFSEGGSTWKMQFSYEEYHSIQIGDVRQAVFFADESYPQLVLMDPRYPKVRGLFTN